MIFDMFYAYSQEKRQILMQRCRLVFIGSVYFLFQALSCVACLRKILQNTNLSSYVQARSQKISIGVGGSKIFGTWDACLGKI